MNVDTIFRLPCFGIVVALSTRGGLTAGALAGTAGNITSELHEECDCEDAGRHADDGPCGACAYNNAVHGIESLILGHACAGIDIGTPAYIEGIESAVQGAANNI